MCQGLKRSRQEESCIWKLADNAPMQMSSTCRHSNVAEMRRGSCLQPCGSHVSADTAVHGVRPRYGWDQHSKDAVLKTIKVLFSPESAHTDASADSSGWLLVSITGAGKSMKVISCLMLMT